MIEKLKWDEQPEDATKEVQNLIDQLVDAVNELQLAKDVMFNRIDVLNNAICDIRKQITAPADPYAEQRKWIGKLCKFKCAGGYCYGLLTNIKRKPCQWPFESLGRAFSTCEPVKPDDDIIYHGE